MFGQAAEVEDSSAYDLQDIQAAGELIAVTLSGPDTYYEFRGQGFGLQFSLAEAFARSVGTRLRMEMASDTAVLLTRLAHGEVDLVALELDTTTLLHSSASVREAWRKYSLSVSQNQWLTRASSKELTDAVNHWWKPELKNHILAEIRNRQHGGNSVRRKARPVMRSSAKGIISDYDELFVRHARAIHWDWRLLAAQCYQESAFDPNAVSWAGAQGLMQIMPGTASHLGLAASDVFIPEKNIAAAVQYLRELSATFSDISDSFERINFILAAYNGGAVHVRDAMTLAALDGHDSHRWSAVEPYILRLSQPAYYRHPSVRGGFLRGQETYDYVRQIHERWGAYRQSARASSAATSPRPNSMPHSSRVKGREAFSLHTTDSI
ncbi:MAG: transglycosylase SLT domain-containing protein [Bacteroidaceae bacterium]|nr:transglycosylase SLT domain-containing protein [Bacteroidaceae bacterium]